MRDLFRQCLAQGFTFTVLGREQVLFSLQRFSNSTYEYNPSQ